MPDFRYSIRALFKQPLFSAIVILTFALGIGANTAVFSVVNAVLLRPLPFHQPQNLVVLAPYDMRTGPLEVSDTSAVSYPDFADWRTQNHVFENIAVYKNQALTLTTDQEAIHLQGEVVSAALFDILGIRPVLGRLFAAAEDEPGHRVVVLGHGLWQRQFAADPNIVGKSITLDGEVFQIVGVMPPRFSFPIAANGPEIWTTMSILRSTRDGTRPMTEQRGNSFMNCVARLKPGVSMQQAQADLDVISAGLRQQYPDSDSDVAVKVLSLGKAMVADARSALMMLCAMAGCVLLVACVNVANLLLARSVSRQREISIRAALGAGRWRLVKQLVMESALLGLGGGLAGLAIATWGLDILKIFLPTSIPRVDQIGPDRYVLGFTAVVSLVVGAVAGLLPAWRASHPNLIGALNEASRGSTEGLRGRRTRSLLVIIEIVLALVLLASAGLLVESFRRLQQVNPGFDPSNVMTARLALPDATYEKPAKTVEFFKQLIGRLSTLPGVSSAAASWWFPLSGSEIVFNFDIQERPLPKAQQPIAQVNVVTHDYFKTMRTAILRGRDFTERDDASAPKVVIVSEAFAKQFFPGENPIGKRITPNGSAEPGDPPVREIVGVVQDIHLISLRDAPKPQIYVPHPQFPIGSVTLLVRPTMIRGCSPRQCTARLTNSIAMFRCTGPACLPNMSLSRSPNPD